MSLESLLQRLVGGWVPSAPGIFEKWVMDRGKEKSGGDLTEGLLYFKGFR